MNKTVKIVKNKKRYLIDREEAKALRRYLGVRKFENLVTDVELSDVPRVVTEATKYISSETTEKEFLGVYAEEFFEQRGEAQEKLFDEQRKKLGLDKLGFTPYIKF